MASKRTVEKEQRLARLFSQLQAAGEDGEYERGLKIVESILSLSPGDPDALHCKVVCLVHNSRFASALKLIESLSGRGGKKAAATEAGEAARSYHFEKAYCLYRLERYEESRKALTCLPPEDARGKELNAQIAYRLEEYEKARAAYASLIKGSADDFSGERLANYTAAAALSNRAASAGGPERAAGADSLGESTMEQCFNKACFLLSEGRGREAEEVLRKAEELCRTSLMEEEDDITEEEIESELAVIRVQLACAMQLQGKSKDSLAAYSSVLRQKTGDSPHFVIAANNVLVLNKDRDVFDSKKKVKMLTSEGAMKKMTSAQRRGILFNRCLFALQTNQLEQCRALVDELASSYPSSEECILAQTGLLVREKRIARSIDALTTHLKSHSPSSPLLYLTLAQLHNIQGNLSKVCSLLRSLPSLPLHLGVVCVLVSHLTLTGTTHSAMEVLDQAVSFWQKEPKSHATKSLLRSLTLYTADYKMGQGSAQEAASILETLQSEHSDDLRVRAKLVAAYCKYDPQKAEILAKTFPSPAVSTGEVSVDVLEQMPSFRHTRRQLAKPDMGETGTTEVKPRTKRKKKRKPRLPKDFNPSKPQDPERWLPMRERSYYRKGRKKGFSSVRGTQGTSYTSANLTALLDASKPKYKPSTEDDAAGECTCVCVRVCVCV